MGAALQSNGKLIVIGSAVITTAVPSTETDVVLARYNSNGVLDATFGGNGNGKRLDGKGDGTVSKAWALAIQICDQFELYVARYNSDGSLDSTFGVNGERTTALNSQGNNDQAYAVALQPADGKIIVAGYTDTYNFALTRYSIVQRVYLPVVAR